MSYHAQTGINWGVLIATIFAVPLVLAWIALSFIGGSLVCADAMSRCSGILWPLLSGLAVILLLAGALGYVVNVAIRAISKRP